MHGVRRRVIGYRGMWLSSASYRRRWKTPLSERALVSAREAASDSVAAVEGWTSFTSCFASKALPQLAGRLSDAVQ